MKEEVEELILKKGTIIHLHGIPFELPEDTTVLGLQSNLDLAYYWSKPHINIDFKESDCSLLSPCEENSEFKETTISESLSSKQSDR